MIKNKYSADDIPFNLKRNKNLILCAYDGRQLLPVYYIIHAEKSTSYSGYINRNPIVLTIFRLIWNQTEILLVQYQSENGKYNLI